MTYFELSSRKTAQQHKSLHLVHDRTVRWKESKTLHASLWKSPSQTKALDPLVETAFEMSPKEMKLSEIRLNMIKRYYRLYVKTMNIIGMRFKMLLGFWAIHTYTCAYALLLPELRLTRRRVRIKITEIKTSIVDYNQREPTFTELHDERIQSLAHVLFADEEMRCMWHTSCLYLQVHLLGSKQDNRQILHLSKETICYNMGKISQR